MAKITDKLTAAVSVAMAEIRKRLVDELQRQGHHLTGALESSITYKVTEDAIGVTAVMFAVDYGLVVEFGVPASRIPFGGRSGRGGRSKYIQGLFRFFQLRGLNEREALGAAFATAHVHKREGMPSRGSYAFSQNGRRTAFIRGSLEQYLPILKDTIGRESGFIIDLIVSDTIRLEPYAVTA